MLNSLPLAAQSAQKNLVMDTHQSDFAEDALQQCLLANQADASDHGLDNLLNDALFDMDQ